MPIDCRVDEEQGRIVAKVSGEFTVDEILAAIDRSVLDPSFRPGFSVLSDHTAVGATLTPPEAKRMIQHLASLRNVMAGASWAVVTSKPASYGMMRMVSVRAENVPMEVQVFTSHAAADQWLSLRETPGAQKQEE